MAYVTLGILCALTGGIIGYVAGVARVAIPIVRCGYGNWEEVKTVLRKHRGRPS